MRSERDGLILDYQKIMREIQGISPRLSIYTKLKSESDILLEKIGGFKEVQKVYDHNRSVKKKLNKIRDKKALEAIIYLSNGQPKCNIEDCVNPRQRYGKRKNGKVKFYGRCKKHRKEVKLIGY